MPETRPISERIDLTYVRRRRYPLSWLLAVAVCTLLLVAAISGEAFSRVFGVYANAMYSSGTMSRAHAMFGDNCLACHQASPGDAKTIGFFMPVQDDACLNCHETFSASHTDKATRYNGKERRVLALIEPVLMASNCAECHVEHRGREHRLNDTPDRVCIQCHMDLKRKGYTKGGHELACARTGVFLPSESTQGGQP